MKVVSRFWERRWGMKWRARIRGAVRFVFSSAMIFSSEKLSRDVKLPWFWIPELYQTVSIVGHFDRMVLTCPGREGISLLSMV